MKNVVACVDGASYTEAVCDYAIWAASRLKTSLKFLHVLVRGDDTPLDASGSIGLGAQESLLAELAELDARRSTLAREHGRQLLEGLRLRAASAGISEAEVHQRHGELVDSVTELQESTRLYVLGQHDEHTKPKRLLLDHNLEGAVRALHRPILVASARFETPANFMIAFDGSPTAHKMIELVAESPLLSGLGCTVAMVGGDPGALAWAEQRLSHAGFDVKAKQLEGEPADALLAYVAQEHVQMLVMGAYGHSRIRQLVVGSTTTNILRRTRIPVFILR